MMSNVTLMFCTGSNCQLDGEARRPRGVLGREKGKGGGGGGTVGKTNLLTLI